MLGERNDEDPSVHDGEDLVATVPYVRVAPASVIATVTSTARGTPATVRIHDTALDVADG